MLLPLVNLFFCNRYVMRTLLLRNFEPAFLVVISAIACVGKCALFRWDARAVLQAFEWCSILSVVFMARPHSFIEESSTI